MPWKADNCVIDSFVLLLSNKANFVLLIYNFENFLEIIHESVHT